MLTSTVCVDCDTLAGLRKLDLNGLRAQLLRVNVFTTMDTVTRLHNMTASNQTREYVHHQIQRRPTHILLFVLRVPATPVALFKGR